MKRAIIHLLATLLMIPAWPVHAEDGYDLWLRYAPVTDQTRREAVGRILREVVVAGGGPTMEAIREELQRAGQGMLGAGLVHIVQGEIEDVSPGKPGLVIGTPGQCELVNGKAIREALEGLGKEGYYMGREGNGRHGPLVIAANEPVGLLYGTFHLLRELQAHGEPRELPLRASPDFKYRLLNHWDNLDRTVERGYAGFSIWDWHRLPGYIHPRYRDYARANASVGINGSVVTNVNANALVLTPAYIETVSYTHLTLPTN